MLDQLLGGAGEHGVSYRQATALLGYTPDALLDEIVDAFAAGDARGVFAAVDKVIEVGQDPRSRGLLLTVEPLGVLEQQRPQEVVLAVADESLDDALGLRVGRLAEVGTEPVVRGEPDVLGRGHDPVGDHPALQAPHPVGEDDLGCAAEDLEALGQHRHRRRGLLISGEADEPEP